MVHCLNNYEYFILTILQVKLLLGTKERTKLLTAMSFPSSHHALTLSAATALNLEISILRSNETVIVRLKK